MKNGLYDLLVGIFEGALSALQYCGNLVLNVLSSIFNFVYTAFASLFKGILWLVDKDRVYHAEQVLDQEDIGNELSILCQVSSVKEDALRRGTWTSNHSEALNQLSQQLYSNCDWSKDKIHTYMRAIVESIPGLSYVSGNDDDEDDDDMIDLNV
jgi:hypothetical protein